MDLYGKYNIKFWLLGGDLMEHVDLESFAQHFNIMVLLDNDPKSDRREFIKQCKTLRVPITQLERYSMESYFPVEVYHECLGERVTVKTFNHAKPVWLQIKGINKSSLKKGSQKFAEKTSLEDIKNTNLERFLKKVKKHLEQTS